MRINCMLLRQIVSSTLNLIILFNIQRTLDVDDLTDLISLNLVAFQTGIMHNLVIIINIIVIIIIAPYWCNF